MKTVVVAGDLIFDNHLTQQPTAKSTHHQTPASTICTRSPGGAWYLKDLIERYACSDTTPQIVEAQGRNEICNATMAENCDKINPVPARAAYQIWSSYEKESGSKEKVSRIHQFFGCEPSSLEKQAPKFSSDPPNPDLLVLDNLGLGFFDEHYKKLKAFQKSGSPKEILLKTSSLLSQTPFWEEIIKNYSERLTVVLSAQTLRERGAAISQGLSWDRTIEEVVNEFENGPSKSDLAKCKRVLIHFGHEGAACFSRTFLNSPETGGAPQLPKAKLEMFLFHPREREGTFKSKRPGIMFGNSSLLTAAVARHILDDKDFPLFIAMGRGLAASRKNLDLGWTFNKKEKEEYLKDVFHEKLGEIFHPPPEKGSKKKLKEEPAEIFRTSFRHGLLADSSTQDPPESPSNLLQDLTGPGYEYVAAKAMEVILFGPDQALSSVPMAKYGKYQTADREEIERINSIANLIHNYQTTLHDQKPLSIAVFGPPGSGKSFAIKQLASELFGSQKSILEFNLSQFKDTVDLHGAFHQVRDASVKGQIPLVFWDEFDSGKLQWLKHFLAPMQDAEFLAGNIKHPFAKAIFVFGGGTGKSFEDFVQKWKEEKDGNFFKEVKGPDFVSRLRGFVNVKGPNPMPGNFIKGEKEKSTPQELKDADPAHLIRRAIMLRTILVTQYSNLLNDESGLASLSASVIRGFLRVENYKHGARSLEAVVKMSNFSETDYFGLPALPAQDLLALHVSPDFLEEVNKEELDSSLIECMAETLHEEWRLDKERNGYKLGKERNDEGKSKTHPLLLSYSELKEADKENNRVTARLTQAKLNDIGYAIESQTESGKKEIKLSTEDQKKLIEIEHDIWMRRYLLKGFTWAKETQDHLHLHRDIAPFKNVQEEDKKLDEIIIDSLLKTLKEKGYSLSKKAH